MSSQYAKKSSSKYSYRLDATRSFASSSARRRNIAAAPVFVNHNPRAVYNRGRAGRLERLAARRADYRIVERRNDAREKFRGQLHVGIQYHHKFRGGHLKKFVVPASVAQVSVIGKDGHLRKMFTNKIHGAVLGSIVHIEQFEVRKGLLQHGLDDRANLVFVIPAEQIDVKLVHGYSAVK